MSTVSEIAQAAAELSLEEQQALLERLQFNLEAHLHPVLHGPRISGLHAGQWWMSDDFNDPLPDEFWLGEDAYTGKDPNDIVSFPELKKA